ncbi:MAG: M48 family metalloprotease [Desulfobulbaceae bacterium]|nr:M48 family metalloprotease [Desulfobulbaceae bacterium]
MKNHRFALTNLTSSPVSRRRFISLAALAAVMFSSEALALDLFQLIDPEGKSKDLQKAKTILKGTQEILESGEEISYEKEFAIGESLALEGLKRYGLPLAEPRLQRYVRLIGGALARNSPRPGIPYYFMVVDSPLQNAFACPGGIIFVCQGLVESMGDEAELACILAHEIAHAGHKHALATIQRSKLFQGIGQISSVTMKGHDAGRFKNLINGLQDVLFEHGLDKNMEFEADLSAMAIAYKTGYDPGGLQRVLEMLKSKQKSATTKGSWYSTHPPVAERISRCRQEMAKYQDVASLARIPARFRAHQKLL